MTELLIGSWLVTGAAGLGWRHAVLAARVRLAEQEERHQRQLARVNAAVDARVAEHTESLSQALAQSRRDALAAFHAAHRTEMAVSA